MLVISFALRDGDASEDRVRRSVESVPERDEDSPLELENLEAIGYAAGTELAPESSEAGPVTVHRAALAHAGLNLVVSGHAPEAYLIDMAGEVLHTWTYRMTERWPDGRKPPRPDQDYWRRAAALPDGSLLAIYEGLGLVKLDRDSNLVWAYPGFAHHDLEVADDGRIFVLTREARMLPRLDETTPALDDHITILDPDGAVLRSVSLYDSFEGSAFDAVLDGTFPEWDPFHTNTIERVPPGAPGSEVLGTGFLVSIREIDLLAVVDVDQTSVAWTARGPWSRQHQPALLSSGHLLLFDNQGLGDRSRVLELSLPDLEVVWSYEEAGDDAFYSRTCGSSQRLENGNTLIVESNRGRAFEVTPSGEIVWEFRSPHRTGEDDRLVATLFDLVRLPRSDAPWLAR